MAPKLNYGFQKSERDRIKKAKKDVKLREREAAAKTKPGATTGKTTSPDTERDS